MYIIERIAQWDAKKNHIFSIDHYLPDGAQGPETKGCLRYNPDKGLSLSMWCFEEHPRAIYHNSNDPVHTDSCMEAFINCFPALSECGYISVEMNANGAAHCSFGTDRQTRKYISEIGLAHPEIRVEKIELAGRKAWQASCIIHRQLLESLYGRDCAFATGHKMKGNFYKCGDHTDLPHWGSWAPVYKLDFHTPEYFGDLTVL